jgi:hypothetical protein
LRKKHVIGAMVAAISLIAAVAAYAVPASQSTLKVTAAASPSKAGTKKKPKPVTLDLTIAGGTVTGSGQPSTTTGFVVKLPKQWNLNSKKYAKKNRCSLEAANTAKSASACPKGSKIGSGTSQALAANGQITQNLLISAHVLTNGSVGFFLTGSSPVSVAVMLEGKVSGRTINVAIPSNVQEPIPGLATGITLLKVKFNGKTKVVKTVKKGKKKVKKNVTLGVIESTGCSGGKWTVNVTDTYRDGSKNVSASAKCKK